MAAEVVPVPSSDLIAPRDAVVIASPADATADHAISAETLALIASSLSASTRRAYIGAMQRWVEWCEATGRTPVPATAATLANYVTELHAQGKSPSTINKSIAAVRYLHIYRGHPRPDDGQARQGLDGVKRERSAAKIRPRKAAPLTPDRLHAMLSAFDWTRPSVRTINVRDRALVVMGFVAAFRESEMTNLDREDVEVFPDRVVVTLWESKTNKTGKPHLETLWLTPGVPEYCPVQCLVAWIRELDAAGFASGPVFRSVVKGGRIRDARMKSSDVGEMVTRRAVLAGLTVSGSSAERTAAGARHYTGHSMRRGMATDLGARGKTAAEIAKVGRWSAVSGVHHEYVAPFEDARHSPARESQAALAGYANTSDGRADDGEEA